MTSTAVQLLERTRNKSIGAVITEPPYATAIYDEGHGANIDRAIRWTLPVAKHIRRVLRPGGSLAVITSSYNAAAWEVASQRAGLEPMGDFVILWMSDNPDRVASVSSVIRWFVRPGLRTPSAHLRLDSNVIVCHEIDPSVRYSITQRPVELTNFLVSMLTVRDDIICDPFCGSGSTLVSAEMCDRDWTGSDTNDSMVIVARRRVQQIELEAADLRPVFYWRNGNMEPI